MNLKIVKQIFFIFVASGLILIIMIGTNKIFNINYSYMTRDVSVLGNVNPFAGFLSSFGILLWAATSAICIFTSVIIKTQKFELLFFLSSGLLTLYLLIDDLFLIHEQFESFFSGGEKLIFLHS